MAPLFRTGVLQSVAALVLCALFIHFGNWQGGKAQRQRDIQAQHDSMAREAPISVTTAALDSVGDQFRRVRVDGSYVAEFQILLDNQIQNDRAGYHVLTPLRIAGSDDLIYVNRGWIPAAMDRTAIPAVPPPGEIVQITGDLVLPPKPRWLSAESAPLVSGSWPVLWQSFDAKLIQERTSRRVAPLILQLDASLAGGYERKWPRFDSRVDMHQSYSFQWYGLAILVVVIYLFAGFKAGARKGKADAADESSTV